MDTKAVIYSDGFKTYDGLVNYGYEKHYRAKHGENFQERMQSGLLELLSDDRKRIINLDTINIYLFLLKELRKYKLNQV